MDTYLETYVDEVMDKQVYRDGIVFRLPGLNVFFPVKIPVENTNLLN